VFVAEQGYCMRGDLCQFDHGTDPVVVDNMPGLAYAPQGMAPAAAIRGAASTNFVPVRPAQGLSGNLSEQPAIPAATAIASAGEDHHFELFAFICTTLLSVVLCHAELVPFYYMSHLSFSCVDFSPLFTHTGF
jgi:hypothetical protein